MSLKSATSASDLTEISQNFAFNYLAALSPSSYLTFLKW